MVEIPWIRVEELKSDLTTARRRIAELEERLRALVEFACSPKFYAANRNRRDELVRAFLTPITPPQPTEPEYIPHLHCPKCEAPVDYPKGTTLIRTSDGQPTLVDMVLVRRDDLETILYDWIRDDCKYHPESHTAYDRLKAALEEKP